MLLTGKTVLITGANTGIGRSTAAALAKLDAHLVLACRSFEKTKPVIDELVSASGNTKIEFLKLELDDLNSVSRCAQEFCDQNIPLHVLINNAGLARGEGVTKQGFETTFGVNHLGHFLLTLKLKTALEAEGVSRVVTVASRAHERWNKPFPWETLQQPTCSFFGWQEYSTSKLANVLFTQELARRWPGQVHSYALHPGVIASDIWRKMPWPLRPLAMSMMGTVEEGCRASVQCASSEDVREHTGRYYDEDGSERRSSALANDQALAAQLWDKSLNWVNQWL
jgi:retinol dehydrogenase 12